ncbi:MAG: hypothetical protein FJZ01_01640 [Candidatus Sericytochromatia bacterium]|nr:hypothetical protein [Candidatus Tanganyikabacteria bacterium]
MAASYDPLLVALSYLIAVGASYTALDLAGQVLAARGRSRALWLLWAAAAMGMAIWSMHFTGMFAFQMDMPMAYDVPVTLLSMLVAIVASGAGLFALTFAPFPGDRGRLAVGGTVMGLGIAAMHYTGMAAMRMPATLTYSPELVLASLLIAVGASTAALWLALALRDEPRAPWSGRKLGAAFIMGLAIFGMHYTGMAAAIFTHAPAIPAPSGPLLIRPTALGAAAIVLGTVLVFSMALLSSYKEALHREQEALKDTFLSLLSHELRTPINAITGFGSILEDGVAGDLTPLQRTYVSKILGGAQTLLSLVDDLLDLSRIQAGQFSLVLAPVAVGPLLRDVVSQLAALWEAKHQMLVEEVAPDLPEILADWQRLRQVLVNLLGNAVKFTGDGGTIWIRARREDGALRFEVEDTDIGIPREFQEKLFRPFVQVNSAPSQAYSGTGLGLSIVRALVEAHGGQVGFTSEVGKGTCFWFSLPARPGTAALGQVGNGVGKQRDQVVG